MPHIPWQAADPVGQCIGRIDRKIKHGKKRAENNSKTAGNHAPGYKFFLQNFFKQQSDHAKKRPHIQIADPPGSKSPLDQFKKFKNRYDQNAFFSKYPA